MTLLERQREYTSWLEKGFPELDLKGLSLVGACAIAGNGSVENQAKPVTLGPKDHGSDGILQWRLDRLDGPRGLKGWSAALGLPWDTLKTQAAFTLWELYSDGRYAPLARDLQEGKKKIETLTANFCWIYERPNKALAHLDKRISHAKSVYLIISRERTKKTVAQTATGAAVVIGGATATNAAQGGSLTVTLVGAALAGAAAIVSPLISHFAKPKDAAPTPAPKPDSAAVATPSPDLLSVALRIDERLLAMLELLRALAADVSALKGQMEQVKAHVASLRAEKDAQVAAALDQMTPEAQAQLDAIKADMAAAAQLAAEAASA